jgi:nucleoside phosphorylase
MLDEVHDKLPVQNKHESTYILGRIDVHSIVISCLPKMGMTAAARSAALLSSGFGSLKFILMVGVGGGVPTIHDIRLGDVVVSMPGKTHKGVVHYGFGTKLQGELCNGSVGSNVRTREDQTTQY